MTYGQFFFVMLGLLAVILLHIAGDKKGYSFSHPSWSCRFQNGLRRGCLHRGRLIFLLTGHNHRDSIQTPQELDHVDLDQRGFAFHLYPDEMHIEPGVWPGV